VLIAQKMRAQLATWLYRWPDFNLCDVIMSELDDDDDDSSASKKLFDDNKNYHMFLQFIYSLLNQSSRDCKRCSI
jgi:hypothetical protein